MSYTVTDVSSENINKLNRLVAEYVMMEPCPTYTHNHADISNVYFSTGGHWVCHSDYESVACSWEPVDFCSNLKWAWIVVRKMNTDEDENTKAKFHLFLDQFFPLGATAESDCCKMICQAALLAKLK